jgi:hypothetical protein
MDEKNEQIIEVEYNKDLVEKYKENYIMEEEGTGAEDTEPYDIQTNVNDVPFEEMNEEGEVIIEEVEEDDKND